MSYTKITDYAAKDGLITGNPSKIVRGAELGAEFDAIVTADALNLKTTALGTGVETFLGTPTSANLLAAVTNETGTGALVFATSPTLVTPALGTPASGTLDSCTTNTESANNNSTQLASTAYADRLTAGTLPGAFTELRSTGLNVTTGGFYNAANKFGVDNNAGTTRFYSSGLNDLTRGSYDFRVSDSVGTLDMSVGTWTSTTFAVIGAISATTTVTGILTNCTGLPAAGVTGTALVAAAIGTTVQAYDADLTTWAGVTPGTGVATALAVNVGSAGAPVVNGGALGTPASGTLDSCTTNTESANNNSTQLASTAYADRLTAGTLPGAFTELRSTGLNVTTGGFYNAANKFGVDNNAGTTRFYSSGLNDLTRGSYDFRVSDSVGTLDMSVGTWTSTTFAVIGAISATTTVTGTQLISNVATGTAPLSVTSTTEVANLKAATATLASTVTVADTTSATCSVGLFESATGSLAAKTDTGITYNATTGVLTATGFSGPLTGNVTGNASGSSGTCTGNAGTATALATARAIYGNNFDGSAALTQIIASTYGGTGNGFTKFTGPTTAERTFTLPDASSTLLYSGGALGTPSSGVATNLTGTAAGLTAGSATLASTITVVDTTSATCNVALFDASTGSLAAKTDSGLIYNATTGVLTATGFSGPLTGTASANALLAGSASQAFAVSTLTAAATGAGSVSVTGTNSSNSGVGVKGESTSTTSGTFAVWGRATGATGSTIGVYGECASATGYGVKAVNSGSGVGLRAESTNGTAIQATAAGAGYALYIEGDITSPVNAPLKIVPANAEPTGPNAIGDMYVTAAGVLKICTVAGTPGTWVSVGAQT